MQFKCVSVSLITIYLYQSNIIIIIFLKESSRSPSNLSICLSVPENFTVWNDLSL